MNSLFRLVAVVTIALALQASARGAGVEYPPGSRIGLVPPPGMMASARFQGFEDRARGAVMVVTELSGQSYARAAQEFSREIMQTGGMEVVSREEFDLPGGPAVIVAARQQAGGVMMRKWALAGLVGDLTVIVVLSMPEDSRDAYPDAAVRAALMSVMVRPKLSVDEMLAVLPYRLGDLGGFHLVRATPTGTAVLTFGPNDTPLPVEQPYFMVASRPGEPPAAADQDRFARRALAEFSARAPDRIVSSEPLRIGGASGHQIIAESRDDRTGDELVMVQWLRFGAGGTIQMFGIARKDQWDAVLPRMRAVRDGLGAK
jgi:hypothetical protein